MQGATDPASLQASMMMYDIDKELLGASATLRGSRLETFRHVVVPLSLPGVIIGIIFVFVLSFGNFIIPATQWGSATLPMFIFQNINTGLNYPAASVLSIIMLAGELLIVYLLTRVLDNLGDSRGVGCQRASGVFFFFSRAGRLGVEWTSSAAERVRDSRTYYVG